MSNAATFGAFASDCTSKRSSRLRCTIQIVAMRNTPNPSATVTAAVWLDGR